MTSKNAEVASAVGVSRPSDLTRVIEEALDLLAARPATDDATSNLSESPPLPSLLARCEDLAARQKSDTALLRRIHSFGPIDMAARDVLSAFANLQILPAPPVIGLPIATSSSTAGFRSHAAEAAGAALNSLSNSLRRQGQALAVLIDHVDWPEMAHSDKESDRSLDVVFVSHPLGAYLRARNCGSLPLRPATLEAYSERYLHFLEQHADLPRFAIENLIARPDTGLKELGEALDLRVPPGARPVMGMTEAPREGADLRYADGRPATEEPIDSPAYARLCRTLDCDPGRIPDTAMVGMPVPTALSTTLPPRREDRSPSRLGGFLPRLARLVQNPEATTGLPNSRLDTIALVELVEDCLGHPDGFFEALDSHLAELLPRDCALLLMACAAHFTACRESIHALSLLAEAKAFVSPDDRALHLFMVELLVGLRRHDLALSALAIDAFSGLNRLEPSAQAALREVLHRHAPAQEAEHGHALLLAHLEAAPPATSQRRRVMIEIGTTRETVPGQGSTEKLAQRCAELEIDFITVDMDPRNSAMARRMFRRSNPRFRAVTAKGEDFLADWEGMIDYCFLDAYDFDHGQHSELRQSRYESFLGSRINDAACHQMHYDCALSLIEKLAPDGVICFDDTWTDAAGQWTAKGKTAMPLLLENGFKVIGACNRAAILVRG